MPQQVNDAYWAEMAEAMARFSDAVLTTNLEAEDINRLADEIEFSEGKAGLEVVTDPDGGSTNVFTDVPCTRWRLSLGASISATIQ